MVKQISKGKEFMRSTYWSAVGMATATMLSLQPVLATGTGTATIWNRFSTILKPDDVLTIGTEETSRAFIPVRNILYISTSQEADL